MKGILLVSVWSGLAGGQLSEVLKWLDKPLWWIISNLWLYYTCINQADIEYKEILRKIGRVLMLIPLEFTSLELSNFTSCNVSNWYFPIFLTLNIRFLPNNLKWNERASRALVLWYISLIWWRWKLATFTKWFTVRGYDVFDLLEHQFSLMKSKFQAYINSSTVI